MLGFACNYSIMDKVYNALHLIWMGSQ